MLQCFDENKGRATGDVDLDEMISTAPRLFASEVRTRPHVYATMTSILRLIGVQQDLVLASSGDTNPIVCEGLGGMKVEDEDRTCSVKREDFVVFMLQRHIGLRSAQPVDFGLRVIHCGVKVVEVSVAQKLVVHHVPLTACIMKRRVVACSREVKPFWMSKLIPNEREVSFTSKGMCDKSYHLVQGQTSVNDGCQLGQIAHVRVHLLVHEPESDGLIADQGLVMRLAVRNRRFLRAQGCGCHTRELSI